MTELNEHPLYRLLDLKSDTEALINCNEKSLDNFSRPLKEVQEETDDQVNETLAEKEKFFSSLNDEERDDHFQNGGGYE